MSELSSVDEQLLGPLKNLLYRVADDQLVVAHRNSEWTGLGPLLEEDIAFSSIAQDKLGHAHLLYDLLHSLGEPEPDTIAFTRDESAFRCCHLVEFPIGEYDFSLARHALCDIADQVRFHAFLESSFEPLRQIGLKLRGEIKYHVFHATTWVRQLGAQGNEESASRMQKAFDRAYPLAFGLFEPQEGDDLLVEAGMFPGEEAIERSWSEHVHQLLREAELQVPEVDDKTVGYGGRQGRHTEHLSPLLEEMTEVFRIDPAAEW